jgi:hypothetical protein
MRALGFAFVGLLLISVPAKAEIACKSEAGLILVSRASDYPGHTDVARPDLLGKEFRIQGLQRRQRQKLVQLKSGTERFLLEETVTPRSLPGTTYASFATTDPNKPKIAGKRYPLPEPKTFAEDYAYNIYSGPLSGLALNIKGCRP